MPPAYRFRPEKWLTRPRRRHDRLRMLRETLACAQQRIWTSERERDNALAERNRMAEQLHQQMNPSGAPWLLVAVLLVLCMALVIALAGGEVQK